MSLIDPKRSPMPVATTRHARVGSVIDRIDQPVVVVDRERFIVAVNPAFARFSGFDPDQLRGTRLDRLLSGTPPPWPATPSTPAPAQSAEFVLAWRTADGGTAIRTCNICELPTSDDPGDPHASDSWVILPPAEKRTPSPPVEPTEARIEMQRVVCTISSRLLEANPEAFPEHIQAALGILGAFAGVDQAQIHLFSEDGATIARTFRWSAAPARRLARRLTGLHLADFAWSMETFRRGEPLLVPSLAAIPPSGAAEKELWSELGLEARVVLPLHAEGKLLGTIGFDSHRPGRPWTGDDLRLLQLTAELFALAIIRWRTNDTLQRLAGEALDSEVRIAAEIHRELLVGRPPGRLRDTEVALRSRPSLLVDGDVIDFFRNTDHQFDVLVGDVMGKGIAAALIGAATRIAFLRARIRLAGDGAGTPAHPESVLGYVHMELASHLERLGSFVTLAFARIDLDRQEMTVVNCGHPPVLLLDASRRNLTRLESVNAPIGIAPQPQFRGTVHPIRPGDLLIFISDGFTEARRADREMFGLERVSEVIRANATASPQQLVDALNQSVDRFVGGQPLQDDCTCVVIRLGQPAGAATTPA